MNDTSRTRTKRHPKRSLVWAPLFLLFAWLTWQTVGNHLDLGIVEPANRVADFDYVNDVEVALDQDGRVVEDWNRNNPADDIIKAALALSTIIALEEFFQALIGRRWLSVLLATVSVPGLVVGGYFLEILIYGLF